MAHHLRKSFLSGMRTAVFSLSVAVPVLSASAQDDERPETPDAKPAAASKASTELYAPKSAEETRTLAIEAVAARGVKDKALLDAVAKVWTLGEAELSTRDLLERVIATAAAIEPAAAEFVKGCSLKDAPLLPPDPKFFADRAPDDFLANHLKLFYGRYLAERRMYDEGLTVLSGLDPKRLVDPATCLFFRAVCEHQLLKKDEALATLKSLRNNVEGAPPSYITVATLMQYELEGLNPKTLGHIARKMSDSERRLDLGRPGERVQKVQDEIIAELDEIIEKLEQEGGGGGGGGGGDGQNNSNQSSSAANDSKVKGSTAPGEVDKKDLGRSAGWGNLNEKQQTKAKNDIARKFPAQYRQAVEEYYKKLARRSPGAGK